MKIVLTLQLAPKAECSSVSGDSLKEIISYCYRGGEQNKNSMKVMLELDFYEQLTHNKFIQISNF